VKISLFRNEFDLGTIFLLGREKPPSKDEHERINE
jgi:hypothetical protein